MNVEVLNQLDSLAELSGKETHTAKYLKKIIKNDLNIQEPISQWGYESFAFALNFGRPGKTILFRADMDAIDSGEGIAKHWCGHHGHMAALLRLIRLMCEERESLPGTAVFFFQSAEENGLGANEAINQGIIDNFKPHAAIAWHNIPGLAENTIIFRKGCFAKASTGILWNIKGKMTHASTPEMGINPAQIIPDLIQHLSNSSAWPSNSLITITHLRVGEPNYGISPGNGEVRATIRSESNEALQQMINYCTDINNFLINKGYTITHSLHEQFPATINNPVLSELFVNYLQHSNIPFQASEQAFPWSEDFGHFSLQIPSLLFGIGSGSHNGGLHQCEFDFPPSLITTASNTLLSFYKHLQQTWRNQLY